MLKHNAAIFITHAILTGPRSRELVTCKPCILLGSTCTPPFPLTFHPSTTMNRIRRNWTSKEDSLLQDLVQKGKFHLQLCEVHST